MMKKNSTRSTVEHISRLANLPLSPDQQKELASQFAETLENISTLNNVDTLGVKPTHHVTGLKNILRADTVDNKRLLTQQEALSSAKHTHKGFFVVDAVINNE